MAKAVSVRNKSTGPRAGYVTPKGGDKAIEEVWAAPGEVVELEDFNEEWFEPADADEKADDKAKDKDETVDDSLILAAVEELDPYNDDHWTAKGAPQVDAVSDILEAKVTRADIDRAAPDKTRPEIGE